MPKKTDEFARIASLFAPLSSREAGAFALEDDAALIRSNHQIVVSTDSYAAGVHFLKETPLDKVAERILRAALSDLAAKGATPRYYFLNAHWQKGTELNTMRAFTRGLLRTQKRFGITLMGGDTIAVPARAQFGLVVMGEIPTRAAMLTRRGASVGDKIYVSGTLGGAMVGLRILQGKKVTTSMSHKTAQACIARYHTPEPRFQLGQRLLGVALSAMDISDGLMGDLAHMCRASGVGAHVETAQIPLQPGVSLREALNAGDDYEILFTIPKARIPALERAATAAKTRVSCIGEMREARFGIHALDPDGKEIRPAGSSYRHF